MPSGILVPHLETYDKWDQPWEFKYEPKGHDDAWHPSGDCLPSPLALYESKLSETHRSISPTLQRTFLVGHFWHQVIQKVVVELGFAQEDDIECIETCAWGHASIDTIRQLPSGERIPWAPYHWVRGQADILLRMPNWSGMVDIKTMNTTDWVQSEKTGLLPLRFADKYEAQLNIYMNLFDQERALILAVNKDSSKFIEFQFERNQQLIEEVYEKWAYVGECLAKDEPPEDGPEPALSFKGPIS